MGGSTIVLFTAAFPFRSYTEEVFLKPELEALSQEFGRIIVVPLERRTDTVRLQHPNVEVDTFIADSVFSRLKPLKVPYLLHPSVAKHYYHFVKESASPARFLSGAFFCLNAKCFADIISRWIKAKKLDTKQTLFYTFWFDHITSALALLAQKQSLKIVTRAHGHDVYDDQVKFRSHEFRRSTMDMLHGIYPASDNATEYICSQYPGHRGKVFTRLLGSVKLFPDKMSSPHSSYDDRWTFLSCARVEPEKRVDKCLALVKAIAGAYPLTKITWIHVGDGSLMNDLRKSIATADMPSNLTIELRGALDNDDVQQIYVSEPVDWVMLLSDSEGGCPIALCEAISYGVPIIATDVGGIPQIVTPDVGVTVPVDAPASSIVGELQPYLNDRRFYDQLRTTCPNIWSLHFSAKELRRQFAQELSRIMSGKQ